MENQTFRGKIYNKVSFLGHSFLDCIFEDCQFIDCLFSNGVFHGCTFRNCNLTLPNFEKARLQEVFFQGGKIVGANFHLVDKKLFFLAFEETVLQSCNFSDLMLKRGRFSRSKFRECDFKGTNLIEGNFQECDFEGTLFHQCDLSGADFRDATNYAIDPSANKIKKGKFSLPEAFSLLKGFDITLE